MLHLLSQLNRVSALNKSTLDTWLDAAQVVTDGAEKIGRLQLKAVKSLVREGAERGRQLSELKRTNFPALAGREAAATSEKVFGYARNLYDTSQATGVQLLELAQVRAAASRNDMFSALDDLTNEIPGGKTGGTKAALDSTRATVEAVIEALARTAKQAIELSDAMIKTTSDSAAQAVNRLSPPA